MAPESPESLDSLRHILKIHGARWGLVVWRRLYLTCMPKRNAAAVAVDVAVAARYIEP